MATAATTTTLLIIITRLFCTVSSAQKSCKDYKFSDTNTLFTSCTDLPVLNAHLHWNYDPFKRTVQIAYRATQKPEGWVSWGINPTGTGMLGTQALVAHQDSRGKMRVFSTQVTTYSTTLIPHSLSFPVTELSAEYYNSEMIIFAVVGPMRNGSSSSCNIIWQAGNSVVNDVPQPHPVTGPNVRSFGALDFLVA